MPACPHARLTTGMDLIERWAETAGQAAKNSVYEALFAVLDGSACRRYPVLHDPDQPWQFLVQVRDGLVINVFADRVDEFGISFIGSLDDAAEKTTMDIPPDQAT